MSVLNFFLNMKKVDDEVNLPHNPPILQLYFNQILTNKLIRISTQTIPPIRGCESVCGLGICESFSPIWRETRTSDLTDEKC